MKETMSKMTERRTTTRLQGIAFNDQHKQGQGQDCFSKCKIIQNKGNTTLSENRLSMPLTRLYPEKLS